MGMLATADANMLPSSPSIGGERLAAPRTGLWRSLATQILGLSARPLVLTFTAVVQSSKARCRSPSSFHRPQFANEALSAFRRPSLPRPPRRLWRRDFKPPPSRPTQTNRPNPRRSPPPVAAVACCCSFFAARFTAAVRRRSRSAWLGRCGGGAISTAAHAPQTPLSLPAYDVMCDDVTYGGGSGGWRSCARTGCGRRLWATDDEGGRDRRAGEVGQRKGVDAIGCRKVTPQR